MKPTNDGLYDSNSKLGADSIKPRHYNPPGKTTLSYRVGTRATSLNRMLARLHAQTSSQGKRPLAALNPEQRDDAAIALLDAWATVVDVLSFYQERIANEGYLRTATEDFSVLELTRPLGYKLSPGVAASTFLAFTVEDTPSAPGVVTVPESTRVQSIPGQGQLPQTFETIEKIEAKAEWNILKPYNPWTRQPQEIYWDTIELKLKGINTQLQPGDNILLIDEGAQQSSQFGCFTLQTVEPHPQEGYTWITWKQEAEQLLNKVLTFLASFLIQTSIRKSQDSQSTAYEVRQLPVIISLNIVFKQKRQLEKPQIFAFRQRVNLFGHNAPNWNEMSEEIKRKYSPYLGGIFCLEKKTDGNWQDNWKPIYSALKNADIRALVTSENGIFAGTHNGIFRSNDEGKQWMSINKGLTNTDIHSLIVNDKGHLFAGATGGNVFRSTNGGDSWVAIGTGSVTILEHQIVVNKEDVHTLPNQEVAVVADSSAIKVVQAPNPEKQVEQPITDAQEAAKEFFNEVPNKTVILQESWTPLNTSLPNTVVYSLATFENSLFAGTDQGVFRATNSGTNWLPINKDLPNTDSNTKLTSTVIYASTHYQDANKHYIFVGTDQGVFRSENKGDNWLPINKGLPNTESNTKLTSTVIYASTHYQDANKHYIFVGTDQGVFRSEDNGDNWIAVNKGLLNTDPKTNLTSPVVYSLTHYQIKDNNNVKQYLVATTNKGVFRSEDNEDNWTPVNSDKNTNLADKTIRCLTINSNGDILAGTTFTGLGATEWPGFTIQDSYIDLDANYTKVLADSWVVLMKQSDKQPYKVKSVATVSRNDFLQTAKLTRLEFEKPEKLSLFGGQRLRETLVLAQSEPLELFENLVQENSPVKGDEIELEQLVQGLEGKKIIVSGKLMRTRFKGTEGSLTSLDCSQSVKLKDNELLIAIAPPTKEANQTTERWYLKNKLGFSRKIEANSGEILLEPAETVSEKAEIASVNHEKGRTTIILREPLQNIYDRATVTINANVALATHGETVVDEVLGSGDGTKANQQFVLKKPPLTYIASSNPSGSKSTLSVWVNNVLWHEVPSLYGLDSYSRSYTLHTDKDGNTIVMFGDGHNGARLPTGEENIRATYRSGIGLDGEVAAGSLTLLQTRPLGIREVTNPLAATGAAPPETPRQIRVKAPLSVKAMKRIVSLQDLEDFTYSFAGIGKAQAKILKASTIGKIAHLTVAAANGDPVRIDSDLYVNLIEEIHAVSAPTQRSRMASNIQIDSYDRHLFNLEAKIRVDPDYQATLVLAEIKAALVAAFAFERREFGQAVTAAEITALIHSIKGVVAVNLERLYCLGDSPQFNSRLQAQEARWENSKALPAQLLLLNLEGLILQEMKP